MTSGHGQLKLEEKKENKIKKIKVKGTSRSRRTGSGPDSVRHYHLARLSTGRIWLLPCRPRRAAQDRRHAYLN